MFQGVSKGVQETSEIPKEFPGESMRLQRVLERFRGFERLQEVFRVISLGLRGSHRRFREPRRF